MKAYDVVQVDWIDATDRNSVSLKEIQERNFASSFGTKRTDVGILLKKDVSGVLLAHDITEDEEADITFIPLEMMRDIITIGQVELPEFLTTE